MGGFTFVEILLGILLVGLIAVANFSVALTSRTSSTRIRSQTTAALALQRISETLSGYYTVDMALTTGPGAAPNGWGLEGDSCAGCYAFAAGDHVLDPAIWMPELPGGTVSFTVTNIPSANGPVAVVNFQIGWPD